MRTPSKSSWGVIEKNNLDAECAFRQFAGKSLKEAEKMFRDNALHYQEDLLAMPSIAFDYYAPIFADYVLSNNAKGDSDGASSFLHMVIELLQANRSLANEKTEKTRINAAKNVATRQAFYDADTDIYGEFSELYDQIIELAART
ncbi:MAG: hypothetical protein OER22_01705 [Gammaproteobacteria bacterium]|nr:hypothetical protein [Gammaproteobacteria bacterium]MDH3372676.1 hypothetical protein [Gammaproteobacteria bacterium]MDH3408582.1 hypothetical protein [Gammaproteobacteria bacterium]MDH3551308.1 hypothetical protein [Gammaproteobacteria bacterium]